jgi:hypothetical protein
VSETPRELPLLIGSAHGEPERLLLISVPDARGMVRVRSWSSDDWGSAPAVREDVRDTLLEWIEARTRAGHSLNQSLNTVRGWLRGTGAATH